jgi:hypothetical protein
MKFVKKLESTIAQKKIGRIFIHPTKEASKCVIPYKSKGLRNALTKRIRMEYLMTLAFMENQRMKPIEDLTYSFNPVLQRLFGVNATLATTVANRTRKNLRKFNITSARQISS